MKCIEAYFSPLKVHTLLNLDGLLNRESLEVTQGHSGLFVAQLLLDCLEVAGGSQPGDGA